MASSQGAGIDRYLLFVLHVRSKVRHVCLYIWPMLFLFSRIRACFSAGGAETISISVYADVCGQLVTCLIKIRLKIGWLFVL